MGNVKLIIIIFFAISFLFFVVSLVTIAILQRKNRRVSERVGSDRRMSDRRLGERRCEVRNCTGRRSNDRRNFDRRLTEGTIFDRKNLLDSFTPRLSGVSG